MFECTMLYNRDGVWRQKGAKRAAIFKCQSPIEVTEPGMEIVSNPEGLSILRTLSLLGL